MSELQEFAELAARYVNNTHRHVFLTGKAGSGKTTFLKHIVQRTFKKAVVTAPTGVAAINAGGVTLHSLLQLPFGTFLPENVGVFDSETQVSTPSSLFKNARFNATKRKLIRELDLMIIDEVSMLRADLLDCIDHTLRYLRKRRNEPFGGIQMLFIGDLMQLPPVVKEHEKKLLAPFYSNSFFFNARALSESPPIRIELQKIYRQQDQRFIDLLNRIRQNEVTDDDHEFLNGRFQDQIDPNELSGYIYLTTHNHKANRINQQQLQKLPGKAATYEASLEGDFPDHMFPGESSLQLKEGAQVMFIKNDPSGQERFFNGKMGWISSLEDDEVWVRTEEGDEMPVEKYRWENKRYTLNKLDDEIEEKVLGSFDQYPIRLAWAVTIHKSQGLTFDKAILDLTDAFAPGQLYVALSRLTSLDGLLLASPIPNSMPPPESELREFIGSFPDRDTILSSLQRDQLTFISQLGKQSFDFGELIGMCDDHVKNFNQRDRKELKEKFLSDFLTSFNELNELRETAGKFQRQIDRILQEGALDHLLERSEKASDYFVPRMTAISEKWDTHRQSLKKERKLKPYFEEVEEIVTLTRKLANEIRKFHLFVDRFSKNELLTKEDLGRKITGSNSSTTKKKDKIPTAQISYDLFREGKDVEAIAEARGMVPGTIEGHLSKYVADGSIDIYELVEKEKLDAITTIYDKGITSMSEIKSKLGEEFSYGDVKMVLAHLQRTKEKAN